MNFNIGGSAIGGNFGGGVFGGNLGGDVYGSGAFGNGALVDPFGTTSLMSLFNYDNNYFLWYCQTYGQPPLGHVKTGGIRHDPYRQSLLQQQQQRQVKKLNLNSIGGYLGQQPPHLSFYPAMLPITGQAGQNPTEADLLAILHAQQQILATQYGNFPALTPPQTNVQQCQPTPFDQILHNFILQQQVYKANISINLRPNQLKNQSTFQQNNNSRFTTPLKAGSSTQKPYSAKFPNFHQKSVTFPPSLAYSHASLLPYQPNANFGMFQASMSELYIAGATKTKMNR